LFALIALKQMRLAENEMSEMKAKLFEIKNPTEYHSNRKSICDILNNANTPTLLGFQLYLLAQSFFSDWNQLTESVAVLQAPEFSRHFTLSHDRLSARCDRGWESVRSVCRNELQGIYYYEVALLTSGPMRIGWCTRRTRREVGEDEHSIGFDGYFRQVVHEDK